MRERRPPQEATAPVRWADECRGALQALAAMLPFVLTFGFLVYGVLGEQAAQIGLAATLIAVVIGGLVFVPLSRSRMPCASPSASASLILGAAVVALVQDPLLAAGLQAGDGPPLAALVAMVGLTVAGSGLLLALLGLSGAGQLVRYVPQPVLAGFMNGIAILIVVSQLPPLLGLPADSWWREGWRSLLSWQGLPLGVAIATAVAMGVLQARWPRLPAPLVTLLVAGIAVAIVKPWLPADGLGRALLTVGTLDAPWQQALEAPWPQALDAPWPRALALWPQALALTPLLDDAAWPLLQRQASTIATTALLLALIGALESVLSLAAVDQLHDARSNPDRELMALGAANMVSGVLGGLPLVYLRLRAMATLDGGGRTRHAAWLGCLMIGAAFFAALPLIERLSTAVVAGVVVMLAWTLVDRWTRQLLQHWWAGTRSPELAANLAVVALVCGVTLVKGFVAGVAAGVLAAMVLFVRAMNRELVHNRYAADSFPSRRVYAAADEALLAPQRQRIEILELEGALFFGNAERLWREAEAPNSGQARRELIVDLRRVSTIDASGAVALSQLAARLQRQGILLRLAGVAADNRHGRALRALGLALAAHDGDTQALKAHADIDQAVEAAEQRMLREAGRAARTPALEPADCDLLLGLDTAQRAVLLAWLKRQTLQAGQRLFAEGDPGDALYLLTEGSVSIIDPGSGQRFASLSPGMCFGETALLDGGGRSADAVADEASTVWVLPAQALDRLQREHPALAAQLRHNLSKHLSQRLRAASAGWRRAAQ